MLDDLRRRLENEIDKVGISKIATSLGISRGTVYNWMAQGNVPLDKLVALQELGLDIRYITSGIHSEILLTPDEQELLTLFREGSIVEKKAAIGALKGMIGGDIYINAVSGGLIAGRDIKTSSEGKNVKKQK